MEVIGIGLANIDLVAHVKDDFLAQHNVPKGLAKKLDDLSFGRLRADLKNYDAIPGGCAANTICGLSAMSGIPTGFLSKIGNDSFESLYRASFRDYNVEYPVEASNQESSQCAVLVTPDGERTFAYTHGASWDLNEKDVDIPALKEARMIYTEVYIFEFGANSGAARVAFETASKHKIPLAMKVMDADFGKRYGQKIRALADAGTLTLLIGNHENLPSVIGAADMNEAIEDFKDWPCDVLLTANKNGSHFISHGMATHYPIEPVENPKNTTGAGDQFVAGFLAGRLDNKPIAECMEFAASSARMILGHDTARPPLVNRHSISF